MRDDLEIAGGPGADPGGSQPAPTPPPETGAAARRVGLTCERLSHRFAGSAGSVLALDEVSFRVEPGEFLCIVGPSGCGKTTLLRIIAGLLPATRGSVRFDGCPEGKQARNALVFQEHGVFPWMTVLDNVAFGLEMRGTGRAERLERASLFIERAGLAAFSDSYPHELSVGMRQRVGIARAFVADVPVLLMDEPFGSLDAQTKIVLQEELLRIWRDDQKLVVYVTHDIDEAVHLGDRVLVMTGRPGTVREDLPIPLSRPRDLTPGQPEAMKITLHIWELLKHEVRRGLSIRA
jgi:NitT/TauT family transport system ATP-binding protein